MIDLVQTVSTHLDADGLVDLTARICWQQRRSTRAPPPTLPRTASKARPRVHYDGPSGR